MRALISRRLDFWLLGGLSCVIWLLLYVATFLKNASLFEVGFMQIAIGANIVSLIIFYPHFMLTYRMAYGRGLPFIRQFWPQLVLVPLLLIFVFTFSYFLFSTPAESSFLPAGFSVGEIIASAAVTFMLLMIGWHQGKQAFGCMMVYAQFDNYRLTAKQRRLLLWSAYALWFVNIVNLHTGANRDGQFFGVRIFRFGFPLSINVGAVALYWICASAVVYKVFYAKWKQSRQLPSPNFLIPHLSLILWWTPPFYTLEFYLLFSTTFHALQYWPFAIRYEEGRRKSRLETKQLLIFGGLAAVVGAFSFWGVPLVADHFLKTPAMRDAAFFLVFVHVTLNIHHYFVDSTIWRLSQPEIQSYVLDSRRASA